MKKSIKIVSLIVAFWSGIGSSMAQPEWIPPDHKGQPLNPGIAFMPQMNQFADEDHNPVHSIHYGSTGHPLELYVQEQTVLSFVARYRHADTTIQDTTLRVDVQPIGEMANTAAEGIPLLETSWYHNYYLAQCPLGAVNVHGYQQLLYKAIYPEVDLVISSNAYGYKFYLVVHPGGDPTEIRLRFSGQESLEPDVLGGLRAILGEKYVRLPQAIAYQVVDGNTVQVPWTADYYEITENQVVKLTVGEYDTTKPLVFDISENNQPLGGEPPLPTPEWGTYYNGNGSSLLNMAPASDGGIVTCGTTASSLFPLTGGLMEEPAGGFDGFYSRFTDQYHMEYTSFIGGTDEDMAYGVAERNGRVVVTGITKSEEGIIYQGPAGSFIDNTIGTEFMNNHGGAGGTCFITMFGNDGQLIWISLYGPKGALEPCNVDLDALGNIYLAGTAYWELGFNALPTAATNAPTFNSLPIWGSGYSQSAMGYASFSPEPPMWSDGFMAKFNNQFQLQWSTLFGGSSYFDRIVDMEVDRSNGVLYLVGTTLSPTGSNPLCTSPTGANPGFPWCPGVTPGAFFVPGEAPGVHDEGVETGFLAEVKTDGELLYCTAIGSPGMPCNANAVTIGNGVVTVVGNTSAVDYATGCTPPSAGAIPQCNASNTFTFPAIPNTNTLNGFVQQIRVGNKALEWSSYVGHQLPFDVSSTDAGHVYISGSAGPLPPGQLPMLANPMYFSDVDPFTVERGVVLGFSPTQQIWGTRYGTLSEPYLAASRALDRIYVGGTKQGNGFIPQNCPSNAVDPWCMHEALLGELCYGQLQYELTVGTNESTPQQHPSLHAYPNPASDHLTITGLPSDHGLIRVELYDAIGRCVLHENTSVRSGSASLRLPPLAPGSYHLQVGEQRGTTQLSTAVIIAP